MEFKKYRARIKDLGGIRSNAFNTILLLDIKDEEGNIFRDHTWVKYSKRFKDFKFGDVVEFTARVEAYESRDGAHKMSLRHLRNISKVA